MFSVFLILLLLLMSGLIAYLGDQLGSKVGKARISLFRLRPKATAVLISSATGILISAFTLFILYLSFEDVRIMLTGLDRIKKEMKTASSELEEKNREIQGLEQEKGRLDSDISKLKAEKDELIKTVEKYSKITRELVAIRTGNLVFSSGEVLATVTFAGNQSSAALQEGLNQALFKLDKSLKERGAGNWRSSSQSFFIPKEKIDESLHALSGPKDHILRILSASNVVRGEFVPLAFEIHEVVPVYKKGDVILKKKIEWNADRRVLEDEIVAFMKEVNQEAIRKGILPDSSGLVGTVTTRSMYEVLTLIEEGAKPVYLRAIAAKDTTNADKLLVELRIGE